MPPSIWSKYFFSVAEELFADGNMNWGRVITANALAKVLTARKRFSLRLKRLEKFGFPMIFLNLYTKSPDSSSNIYLSDTCLYKHNTNNKHTI